MRRATGMLVFCLLLLAGLRRGCASDDPAGLRIVDATPDFVRFWDRAQKRPEAARVKLFLDTVVSSHPELYTTDVLGRMALTGAKEDERRRIVGAYLKEVVPYVQRMRMMSASIGRDLGGYMRDFRGTFPDYAAATPIYFMVSLMSFDGATRSVNGHVALLFGIDGIARYHAPDEKLSILFDHELFHQYREQLYPGPADDGTPLWMSLWEEGLATYVSQQMNPGTPDAAALMSATLADKATPLLPALARELLANFASKDREEYSAFFYGQNKRPDLPPRSGYYVGLRVARALATGRTLHELAALHGSELEVAVRGALEGLSREP